MGIVIIKNTEQLIETVRYIATQTEKLCRKAIGEELPVHSLTVFAHEQEEYNNLVAILSELGSPYNENNGPRVILHIPIRIGTNTITHLRIRKPDLGRPQVGCNDFDVENYNEFKGNYLELYPDNLRLIIRHEYEMIEFFDPRFDVLAYVVSKNNMKTAIIIHGMPSKDEYLARGSTATQGHWFPWLKGELERNGFEVFMPEMPEPYAPDYEKWAHEFEKLPLDSDTILVGHSCGGGFLVRWLSENKFRVGKVVLVAPWIDPTHAWAPKMFNELKIDEGVAGRSASMTEFISLDDNKEELDTLEILKSTIKGLQVKEFTDKGHFTFGDMKTHEFPELLKILL